eukprot:1882112-Pleurochrysis_carterae.AAC.1
MQAPLGIASTTSHLCMSALECNTLVDRLTERHSEANDVRLPQRSGRQAARQSATAATACQVFKIDVVMSLHLWMAAQKRGFSGGSAVKRAPHQCRVCARHDERTGLSSFSTTR